MNNCFEFFCVETLCSMSEELSHLRGENEALKREIERLRAEVHVHVVYIHVYIQNIYVHVHTCIHIYVCILTQNSDIVAAIEDMEQQIREKDLLLDQAE